MSRRGAGTAGAARALAGLAALGAVLVAAGAAWAVSPAPPDPRAAGGIGDAAADQTVVEAGRGLFTSNCAACHGPAGQGGNGGPSLDRRRARRPPTSTCAPGACRCRRLASGSSARTRTSTTPRSRRSSPTSRRSGPGPGIPQVASSGDLHRGWELFQANCAACHNATGAGNAIGGGYVAVDLGKADPTTVAEATIIGPGAMPNFAFDDASLADIAAYVRWLRERPDARRRAHRTGGTRRRGVRGGRDRAAAADPRRAVRGPPGQARGCPGARTPDGRRTVTRRERRAERLVLACFGVTLLTGLGLLGVYLFGGDTQLQGILLAVCLGGLGAGIVVWAQELMSNDDREEERHPMGTGPEGSAAVAEAPDRRGGVQPPADAPGRPAGCLRRPHRSAGDPGPVARAGAGAQPVRDALEEGSRLVGFDGQPVHADTIPQDGVLTVFPEGYPGSADGQTLLIHAGAEPAPAPGRRGDLGPGRVRRLFQGLHPRRLPGRPVPRGAGPAHLPLPPVHVRRHARRRARVRAGRPAPAPAADPARGRRHVHGPGRLRRAGRAVVLGQGARPVRLRRRREPPRVDAARAARSTARARARDAEAARRRSDRVSRRGRGARPSSSASRVGWTSAPGLASLVRTTLRKVFPDHWSFLLGRARAVLLRDPPRDRDVPDLLLRPVGGGHHLPGPVRPPPGRDGLAGL